MVLYNGKFYGMTNLGGANNCGVIYEWDFVNNVYTKKIDLDSINGKNPDGSLTLIGNKFYGFTHNGGINNKGVLFEWDPATNIYTKRYNFASATGSNPVGKLSVFNNKFYAMTNLGGANNQGVIYEWDYNSNVYTKKFDFDSIRGQHPLGYLTLYNNKFYGMTYEGGIYETPVDYDHYGVLFEWNAATNVFVKKRDLGVIQYSNIQSGHGPLGSLTLKGNVLWGITTEGVGNGTIFSWAPASNTWIDHFLNLGGYWDIHYKNEDRFQAPGVASFGAMLLSGGNFLCTSSGGAGALQGCIFEYLPDSNQIRRSVNMLAADGAFPKGSLTKLGNKLFGSTFVGGNNHFGNIFEWDLSTAQYKERFAFDGYRSGGIPGSTLTFYNGKFYGSRTYTNSLSNPAGFWRSWISSRQGSNIFSWDPVTNQFEANSENQPALTQTAPLTLHNGKFYTTGSNGVSPDILEYNPVTDSIRDVVSFTPFTGDFQMYEDYSNECGLTYYNGKFYGMTPSKRPVGSPVVTLKGGIYEWDPVTNIITSKIDFDDNTGIIPMGDLTLVGNVFYGLTSGITLNFGTLFKWDPATNIFEKKINFGVNIDYILNPEGTLTYSGGKLYGLGYGFDLPSSLLNSGGQSPGSAAIYPGSVFEFDPVLDTLTSVQVFDYNGGLANSGVNPAFTKLLEVIPNELPQLSNTPATQIVCANQNTTANFTISDADLDTMQFQISSSNPALIPVANISTTHIDSNYTLQYNPVTGQSGNTAINIIANDGYGGSVNFSFNIIVNALPSVSSTSSPASATVCEGESITLNGNGAATYTWSGGISNNTAFIPPTGTTVYTVTGTYVNGCSNTNTQTVITSRPAMPSISITADISQGSIGDPVIYTAVTNLPDPYLINWYRNNVFQTSATTNTWATTIVAGDNSVNAILSGASQCLEPNSAVSNLLELNSTEGINVFPNPTTGEVIISGLMINDEIGLYNSIGQRMINTTGKNILSNQNRLQLNGLANGTYILIIKRNEEMFVKKIVKVRI